MNKRWGGLLVLAGLALFPIVMQHGIASLKTYVSGNPHFQERAKPRTRRCTVGLIVSLMADVQSCRHSWPPRAAAFRMDDWQWPTSARAAYPSRIRV